MSLLLGRFLRAFYSAGGSGSMSIRASDGGEPPLPPCGSRVGVEVALEPCRLRDADEWCPDLLGVPRFMIRHRNAGVQWWIGGGRCSPRAIRGRTDLGTTNPSAYRFAKTLRPQIGADVQWIP
jgi:hypothetical protein